MKAIIGRNLKYLREANHFTAQHMADCLSINRSAYANYEAGLREMPLALLEKAADFLGVDLAVLYEEDETKRSDVLESAFRMENLTADDCREIAYFKSIVMNYMKMIHAYEKIIIERSR